MKVLPFRPSFQNNNMSFVEKTVMLFEIKIKSWSIFDIKSYEN